MINERNRPIAMIKGDTVSFNMEFTGLSSDLDTAYFSAKANYSDNTYTFRKSLNDGITKVSTGVYNVRLAPSDTSNTTPGRYYYDLEIGVNNDIFTIMFGEINILPEVS